MNSGADVEPKEPQTPDGLMMASEVADYLRFSVTKVYRMAQAG